MPIFNFEADIHPNHAKYLKRSVYITISLFFLALALGLLILFAIDRVIEYEEQRELEHNTKVIHTNV